MLNHKKTYVTSLTTTSMVATYMDSTSTTTTTPFGV